MNKFTQAIHTLLKNERFYAEFILSSKIVWDNKSVKTAAVGIKDFTQTFYFNTAFIDKLPLNELVGLIKHECLHALFKHVPFKEKLKDHKMWNIAMDICINQYIEEMPKTECTPEHLEKLIEKPVERFKDHIYYYNLLIENKDKIPESMETSDDHKEGEEFQSADKQEIDAVLREQLMDTLKRAGAGNVPTACQHILNELLKAPALSWKRLLRNFVSKSVAVDRKLTRKKPHRRFGLDQPGVKKKRRIVIGVPIDSSGSVSDELYVEFLAELQSIVKNVGKAYFIDADCEIHDVQKLSGNKKIDMKRIGCGGTAYNPALKKCKELNCDVIVYMGDGDCADKPENPNIPVLWVLPNNNCLNPSDFGKVLYLK